MQCYSSYKPSILLCIAVILAGSVCNPPVAKTQEDSLWHDLGIYGGQISSISADNALNLYAGSYLGGGLFTSSDSGTTWKEISWFKDTEVYDIAIDPHNHGTLWIANNQFVNVTHDYGTTWRTCYFAEEESRFCYTVKIDPHDTSGNTVYAGTGGHDGTDESGAVFKTIDGGSTWFKTSLIAQNNIIKLSINPAIENEVWAASGIILGESQGSIYVTADGGGSWHLWDIGWFVDEILVHPAYPQTVFAAGENGILFRADGADASKAWHTSLPDRICQSIYISQRQPDTIYAGLINMTALSSDTGATWTYYNSENQFLSMTEDPLNQDILYGGDVNRGVFKSQDRAQQWLEVNNGIKANHIYSLAASPFVQDAILAGTLSGVYILNKDRQWQLINKGRSEAVAFHALQENILYAGFDWKLGKSTDHGLTWSYKPVSSQAEAHDISSIAVSSRAPDMVFAGIYFYSGKHGEIIKSTDNGDTFSRVWETSAPVNVVTIHPADPHYILAGTGSFYAPVSPGGLYMSRDGGQTWKPTSLNNVIVNGIAVNEADPDIMYAGCGGSDNTYAGIFKSSDGGSTWKKISRGLPQEYSITALQIDAGNTDILYAASFYDGIFLSVDGGEYWSRIGSTDYLVYDMTGSKKQHAIKQPVKSAENAPSPLPISSLMTGTTGGIFQFASLGTGMITGTITARPGGAYIDGATITTGCGSSCLSSDGYYLLLVPAGIHSVTIEAPGYVPATVTGIQVSTGQSSSCDIILEQQPADGGCPATAILHGTEHQPYLDFLRKFRDRVLLKTDYGKKLITVYYAAGNEVWQLLAANPSFRAQCQRLLTDIMPVVIAALARKPVTITPDLLHTADRLMVTIEHAAPGDLKQEILQIRKEISLGRLLKVLEGRQFTYPQPHGKIKCSAVN